MVKIKNPESHKLPATLHSSVVITEIESPLPLIYFSFHFSIHGVLLVGGGERTNVSELIVFLVSGKTSYDSPPFPQSLV